MFVFTKGHKLNNPLLSYVVVDFKKVWFKYSDLKQQITVVQEVRTEAATGGDL